MSLTHHEADQAMNLTAHDAGRAAPDRAMPGLVALAADGHIPGQAPERLLPGQAPERLLMDAAERALRAPRGRVAMALHLSRLNNPSPRPYQARIALALMLDTAQRLGGQVFPMRNTDLVMLCASPEEDMRPGRPSPAPLGLMASLESLFGFDAPDASLTSIWRLDEQPSAFRDYIALRQTDAQTRETRTTEGVPASGLAGLMVRLAGLDLRQILMQQTAITLQSGAGAPLSMRLRPLYREVLFAPVPAQASNDAAALADPFIHRHVADVLDRRVLALLTEDLRTAGTLTRAARLLDIPMHLNLSPEAIVSPGFARLVEAARPAGTRLAIEMSALDAAADPALTAFAGRLLVQAGIGLVLDGIDHAGLAMIDTTRLAPHMVKLTWSSRLADGPRSLLGPIEAAIAAIGPARLVLNEADGEAALKWGQSHGIIHYQGPFIDAVQAAARIGICHSARTCTLRQCTARAHAVSPGPRSGCGNQGLLDLSGQVPTARGIAVAVAA